MMVDYFVAHDNSSAALVVKHGPREQPRGRLRRRQEAALGTFIDGHGIEPIVELGQLYEILSGRSFEEIVGDSDTLEVVADAKSGQLVVVRTGSAFDQAVLEADGRTLREAAQQWAEIEEFAGKYEAEELLDFVRQLRELVAEANGAGGRVYSWVSV